MPWDVLEPATDARALLPSTPCPALQYEHEVVFEDAFGGHVAVPADDVYAQAQPAVVPIPLDQGPHDRSG